ncbi:MAG: MBL fold metallo-hydrolase [Lachnospiraceae bacterium]|nr:MBL fold metallo-hydrolase [Lachnospiraceae bacterium]
MRIAPIASGSSGNCIYVGSNNTHILVDVGISGKRVDEGLAGLDICGKDLDGILITHEHVDHIGGLGVICRKYSIPVYATPDTIEAIKAYKYLGKVEDDIFHPIPADVDWNIKDVTIRAFKTSHDAADPVAYTFSSEGKKIAVATDMGNFTDYTVENLMGMDSILLEANHDIRMLQVGPYPYPLKRRILSDEGHLSNEASGRLLSQILNDKMNSIFLGHLSKENNMPDLAYETVRVEIDAADNKYRANDFKIMIAKRDTPSEVVNL